MLYEPRPTLSGAFLTLAIVIGEFTIGAFLNRPAFGPYLSNIGTNKTFEPAAVSVISFILTWMAMGGWRFFLRRMLKWLRSEATAVCCGVRP